MIGKGFPLGFFRLLQAIATTLATVTIAAMLLPATGLAGDEMFASVGTGQVNGIYYPVGKAICQVVNRNLRTDGVR
jgi:TRAP-type uncharacterized transport system substrate-binding protein